jgi:hypothetical protein
MLVSRETREAFKQRYEFITVVLNTQKAAAQKERRILLKFYIILVSEDNGSFV